MTDKELLEAAARAAGYQYKWNLDGLLIDAHCGRWNPLTDDGDALRLAVKLGIDVRPSMAGGPRFHYAWRDGHTFAGDDRDPYAATRRAIVRAAASLTK